MYTELQRFVERLPLNDEIEFPIGSGSPLFWNESLRVLGLVTGQGVRRGAISVTGLGLDPRFNLTTSYFIFAGIAGVDPAVGSVGSAFWALHAIHADSGYRFDAREVPSAWHGVTVVPEERNEPFSEPPPLNYPDIMTFNLKPFALWAYNLSQHVVLPDTSLLQTVRQDYPSNSPASQKPTVRLGDVVSGDFYWAGKYLTSFYRRWYRYWLDSQDFDTNFATTAMEDTAVITALHCLHNGSRVNASRVAVLRTISDYSHQPPNQQLIPWFFAKSHLAAETPAFEAAYLTVRPVLDALLSYSFSRDEDIVFF